MVVVPAPVGHLRQREAAAARVRAGAIAIMPGTITRNGNSIFGTAAISGVRRAADIELAAIARCTTRKSVHQ